MKILKYFNYIFILVFTLKSDEKNNELKIKFLKIFVV